MATFKYELKYKSPRRWEWRWGFPGRDGDWCAEGTAAGEIAGLRKLVESIGGCVEDMENEE